MPNHEEKAIELFIDWRQILSQLIKKSWLILICGFLAACAVFVNNKFLATPKYSSSVMFYVNNKSISESKPNTSLTASDLSAAQSLVDTYIAIIDSRTTMEIVAERDGLEYTYSQISGMTSVEKIEGTELFKVIVTSENAEEAQKIAQCMADVLPSRIENIVDGSSMRIVEDPVLNNNQVYPVNTAITMIKVFILVSLVAAALVAVYSIIDDTIRTEDYLMRTYELPILTVIPDFKTGSQQGYYYKNGYYSYQSHEAIAAAEETEGEENA